MNNFNYKKIFFISIIGILLIGNSVENAIIYMSVLPISPFGFEESGIQLLYPVTTGLIVYLFLWGSNLFITCDINKLWRNLPAYCILTTCIPIFIHLIGLLPLPWSNIYLYYYGMLIGLIQCPLLIFLYVREFKI